MDHLTINVQSFVAFCLAITKLLDFKVWKIGQNLNANMEGSRRDSHNLLYSGKVWRGESLANLANRLWFAKRKPSNLILKIDNLLANLLIRQTFFRQMLEKS